VHLALLDLVVSVARLLREAVAALDLLGDLLGQGERFVFVIQARRPLSAGSSSRGGASSRRDCSR
jgi:hypothetical protein